MESKSSSNRTRRELGRYSERVQTIVEFARGPRILHLGACGTLKPEGEMFRHFTHGALVDAGFSVLATDVNEAGIEWMRGLGYEVEYLDAEAIPPEGETFDTIAAGELIEHLSNPGLMLDGCARRLKSDGVLVISTPQPFSIPHVLIYMLRFGAFNLEHACWFDAQTLAQTLGRHGFEVAQLRFVDDLYVEGAGPAFRMLARAWLAVRRLFPVRYRTNIVVAARLKAGGSERKQPYLKDWEGSG